MGLFFPENGISGTADSGNHPDNPNDSTTIPKTQVEPGHDFQKELRVLFPAFDSPHTVASQRDRTTVYIRVGRSIAAPRWTRGNKQMRLPRRWRQLIKLDYIRGPRDASQ